MLKNNPLISVIIIFYNAEKFISEAIESVLNQTYENWELILVDDGSSDPSSEIAKAFEQKFSPKINYVCHKNHMTLGTSASRNLGLQNSNGEYVAFLDADDVWIPQKLEIQINLFYENPTAGMIYGKDKYWYSWDDNCNKENDDYIMDHKINADRMIYPPDLFILFLKQVAMLPGICNVMFKREVLDSVGRFENSFSTLYEDQVIISKVCLSFPVYITNTLFAYYRQHDDSICAKMIKTKDWQIERNKYLDWLGSYLIEQKLSDRNVWAAWRLAVFRNKYKLFARITKIYRKLIFLI